MTSRRHQNPTRTSKCETSLHCCAYATVCTDNRGWLTEHALPLTQGGLGSKLLQLPVECLPFTLLKEVNGTGASYYILPPMLTNTHHVSYAFSVLHKWGLCCQPAFTVTASGAFIDKSSALQPVSVRVNPKTERYAGKVAMLDRAAELSECLA